MGLKILTLGRTTLTTPRFRRKKKLCGWIRLIFAYTVSMLYPVQDFILIEFLYFSLSLSFSFMVILDYESDRASATFRFQDRTSAKESDLATRCRGRNGILSSGHRLPHRFLAKILNLGASENGLGRTHQEVNVYGGGDA